MNGGGPVAASIARTAVSLASDPEWPSHTLRSDGPGVAARRASASATAGPLIEDSTLAAAMFDAALVTASTTAGCPYPRPAAPHDAERSRSRRPSSVIRYEPFPPVTASG